MPKHDRPLRYTVTDDEEADRLMKELAEDGLTALRISTKDGSTSINNKCVDSIFDVIDKEIERLGLTAVPGIVALATYLGRQCAVQDLQIGEMGMHPQIAGDVLITSYEQLLHSMMGGPGQRRDN